MNGKRAQYDLKAAKALLMSAADKLATAKWFKSWRTSVHYFPDDSEPESVTLHVFKNHWYNEDRKGIHFETSLSAPVWKSQELPIMIHIFHTPHVPGTSIKRIEISKPFIDATFDEVSKWEGYKFRAGRYGTHPFTRTLKFDFDNFDTLVSREFSKLCLYLGPVMDETLASVLKQ